MIVIVVLVCIIPTTVVRWMIISPVIMCVCIFALYYYSPSSLVFLFRTSIHAGSPFKIFLPSVFFVVSAHDVLCVLYVCM
jgi:hypothetical protein